MFRIDVRAKRTPAPGTSLALLAILSVFAIAFLPSAASAETGGAGEIGEPPAGPIAVPAGSSPLDRQGMWIWYIDKSEGGSLPRIIAKAKRYDIGTLYVKSGDGGSLWSQFTSSMVETFHQAGSTSAPGSSSTATARSPRPRSAPPRSRAAPTAW